MENFILGIFDDLICCLSRRLLAYRASEKELVKLVNGAVSRAIKENQWAKLSEDHKENENE